MQVQRLEINNILSIEKAELTFKDKGLILVEGWNYDEGRGNGSGKSAIFNALSFGLYDKIPREITKGEILRIGSKSASVAVDVIVGSDIYRACRTRPTGCTYYKNGQSLNINQQEFEDRLGLSYDQFLVTMYTSQDASKRFLTLNDRGKKDFILEVLKLKDFDKYSKEAKNQIKELETSNIIKVTELDGLKMNKKTLSEMVVDEDYLQRRSNENEDEIKAFQLKIDKLQEIPTPDSSKYEVIEKKIFDKNIEFQSIRNEISANQKVLKVRASTIKPFEVQSPDAQCPHCDEEVNISGKMLIKITDQDLLRKLHNDAIDKTREGITKIETTIKELTSKLEGERKIEDLKNKLKTSKSSDQKMYTDALKDIQQLASKINNKKTENRGYLVDINISQSKKKKLDNIVDRMYKVENSIDINKAEMDMLRLVSGVFAPTGAPAYIMDSIVESFNESAAKYIGMVWPNATYKLQTHKINSDKKVIAKFSELLLMGGKERSIGSLSGGELKSLSLALDFAIIDVLNKQYSITINPVILDEPFNGLDSVGKEIVIELLDKLSRDHQIWVVDHACTLKVMFSDTYLVEKRNGVSSITKNF